jgi:biopolymer transport protein ExbD
MKFERHAKILRGPINAAPVAGVVMLLLIFIFVSSLLYTPGVLIQLPTSGSLAVTDNPTVVVAVDSGGRYFINNKPVEPAELRTEFKNRLRSAALQSKKLTLVLYADKAASNEVMMRVETLAQAAGITDVLVVARPLSFGPQQ